jgi:uncharacterized membrane protein YphA (DoxX/SURF4 family)
MDTASTVPATSARATWPRWLLLAGRVILGGVFIYAGYAKLREPWMLFAFSINSYQILPESIVSILARTLPWFELLLGVVVVSGVALRWTATAASGLFTVFSAAMLRAYVKNLSIDCGCFGYGEKLGPMRFTFEGALLALALGVTIGAFLMHRRRR